MCNNRTLGREIVGMAEGEKMARKKWANAILYVAAVFFASAGRNRTRFGAGTLG